MVVRVSVNHYTSPSRRGLDLGLNDIDTGEMYGSGAAEEVVGEAIVGRRNEVFLVSKVLPQHSSRSNCRRDRGAACRKALALLCVAFFLLPRPKLH